MLDQVLTKETVTAVHYQQQWWGAVQRVLAMVPVLTETCLPAYLSACSLEVSQREDHVQEIAGEAYLSCGLGRPPGW